MPELADQSKRGARIALDRIPVEESGMSPLEIWCNESQERYALAIARDRLPAFDWLARRERCPLCGDRADRRGSSIDRRSVAGTRAVDMPMDVLLGKPPRMHRDVRHVSSCYPSFDGAGLSIGELRARCAASSDGRQQIVSWSRSAIELSAV